MSKLPILVDGPPPLLVEMIDDRYELVPWEAVPAGRDLDRIEAIITYGHPTVDGPLLDLVLGGDGLVVLLGCLEHLVQLVARDSVLDLELVEERAAEEGETYVV